MPFLFLRPFARALSLYSGGGLMYNSAIKLKRYSSMFNKAKKAPDRPFCSAVIVAGGSSSRMGEDKLAMELGGMTVIERTLRVFQASAYCDEIVAVTRSEKIPEVAAIAREAGVTKLKCVVTGGGTRMASSRAGVRECSAAAGLIAIHDAARPLVTEEIISRAVRAAAERGAAAPAIHVKDTVRQARGGRVLRTLERDELFLMQTPQVFRADLIRAALDEAVKLRLSLTDDCAAVMLLDAEVFLVEGSEENLKLTTPADVYAAEAILDKRGEA